MKVCLQKKGGTIIVAKGNYKINGPIPFVSNVNLHLEEGAKLFFDTNPKRLFYCFNKLGRYITVQL